MVSSRLSSGVSGIDFDDRTGFVEAVFPEAKRAVTKRWPNSYVRGSFALSVESSGRSDAAFVRLLSSSMRSVIPLLASEDCLSRL
jgi:hypothetical protein